MFTVTDLLAEPDLALRGVVVPDGDVAVRWVAVSELDDPAPFLEGGEVLLTTGINTRNWNHEWDGYIRRLVAAGTVALGLATGLTHQRIPASLTTACRTHGLNLVEVPRATAFVAISRTVGRRLEERGVASARQAFAMQRELTQAALQRGDPDAVPRRLAAVLGGAVATVTADGRWDTAPSGDHAGRLRLAETAAEVRRLRPQGLRASAVTTDSQGTTVVQPVGLGGSPSLYLAAWFPGRLRDAERSAITTAVALVGLALENRRDQRETNRRLRRRAMELLAEGDARTASIVLAAADGVSPEEIRLPARLRAVVAAGAPIDMDRGLERLERSAEGGRLLLAARDDRAGTGAELWAIGAPQQSSRFATDLADCGLRVGVGSVVRPTELGRSRAAASHALVHTTEAALVVRWDELVSGGVLGLIDQAAGESFVTTMLTPLARYGERRGELEQTLRAFLQQHGRIGPLADQLGVHRNTVRNRLLEIESALGRSLDDPATRVNIWVALELEATQRLRTL